MDRLIAKAKADMTKTVEIAKKDIAAFRTGRASPALVEGLEVEYYGTKTPVNQIASIQVVDTRLLAITPWDKNALSAIRNIRRSTNEAIDKMEEAEGLSEAEVRVGKEEVQELTDAHTEALEEIG